MSAASGTVERAGPLASPESAKPSTRGGLVAPVILIILLSVLTAMVLVLTSARALNQNTRGASQNLANSMLAGKAKALRVLAMHHARSEDAARHLSAELDEVWADRNIGGRLAEAYGLAASMVIGADDRTVIAFVKGQWTELDAFAYIPAGLRVLVERARKGPRRQPAAVTGLTRIDGLVHLVAVSPIIPGLSGEVRSPPGARPVLVLAQAFDRRLLQEAGTAFGLEGLEFFPDRPPRRLSAIGLAGVDGGLLGYLAWRDALPGDILLWWLTPSLACALLAITYLLYQFFRSTDLVLERQAYLMTLLRRERELRGLKSRIVSMMSHELRTPLSTIQAAADLLDRYEGRLSFEERRRELGAIRTAVGGLNRMMVDVLALGRSDADAAQAPGTRLNLHHFCQELWDETVRALGASHKLTLSGPAADRTVVVDETLLRAILSNLFQNAIKYSPRCEEVAVEITGDGGDCRIRVTDYGEGIPAEQCDKVFEAFHRATTSTATSGTGLGLAVAKSAAERMGGSLGVESVPGRGSTFELVLPELLKARSSKRRKEES